MDIDNSLALSASGLDVQRQRMNVIASNLANVNSSKSVNGGPFRRRDLLIRSAPVGQPFRNMLDAAVRQEPPGVQAVRIVEDRRPPRQVYEPHHPDADAQGNVAMPDINVMEEMVNLLTASRAYEANVTAMNVTKTMAQKALEIGR